jgi:hypothetical protein
MERGLAINRQPVHIVTSHLQLSGDLEVIGNPLMFLNDPSRDDVVMRDTRVAPLYPSGPFKGLSQPQLTVRKGDFAFVYFSDSEARDSIQLLAREESAVIYTALAIVRGTFHLPAEAPQATFLSAVTSDMIPVTDAQFFWLTSLPMPFPDRCELLMVGKKYIQMYHSA